MGSLLALNHFKTFGSVVAIKPTVTISMLPLTVRSKFPNAKDQKRDNGAHRPGRLPRRHLRRRRRRHRTQLVHPTTRLGSVARTSAGTRCGS